MAGRLRRGFTFANVCSFLALTIALGTGGAYAANTVFSTDIVDGEVKNADIAASAITSAKINNGSVINSELGAGAVTGDKIATGAVTSADVLTSTLLGEDVAPDTLTGANISEASLAKVPDADTVDGLDSPALVGPRAFGRVDPGTCALTTPFACPVLESKGVSAITRPFDGIYCIAVTGVDPFSVPLIATVDFSTTGVPRGNASAMTRESNTDCPTGQFALITQRQPSTTVATPSGGATTVAGNATSANGVGFTFLVP